MRVAAAACAGREQGSGRPVETLDGAGQCLRVALLLEEPQISVGRRVVDLDQREDEALLEQRGRRRRRRGALAVAA